MCGSSDIIHPPHIIPAQSHVENTPSLPQHFKTSCAASLGQRSPSANPGLLPERKTTLRGATRNSTQVTPAVSGAELSSSMRARTSRREVEPGLIATTFLSTTLENPNTTLDPVQPHQASSPYPTLLRIPRQCHPLPTSTAITRSTTSRSDKYVEYTKDDLRGTKRTSLDLSPVSL